MAVRVSGRVLEINSARTGTSIELDNDPAVGPKGNVWLLKIDHSNYNALFSLILAAAANRWRITVRIEGDAEIDINTDAAIRNIGVGFK